MTYFNIIEGDLIDFRDGGFYFYSPNRAVYIFGEIIRNNKLGIYLNKIDETDIDAFKLTSVNVLSRNKNEYHKVLISGKIFFAHQNCFEKYYEGL